MRFPIGDHLLLEDIVKSTVASGQLKVNRYKSMCSIVTSFLVYYCFLELRAKV